MEDVTDNAPYEANISVIHEAFVKRIGILLD